MTIHPSMGPFPDRPSEPPEPDPDTCPVCDYVMWGECERCGWPDEPDGEWHDAERRAA